MISPVIPAHDADTIALDFGVFVAEQARAYRTSQSAILAAILPFLDREPVLAPKPSESTSPKPSGSGPDNALDRVLITIPSQPEETSQAHAPAAETPASQAAGEATDGEAVTPRPSPSVAPETGLRELAEREAAEAHGGEGAAAPAAGESPAIPAAEDVGAQPVGGENVAEPEEPETETEIDAAVGGPAGAAGSTVGTGAGSGKSVEPSGSAAPNGASNSVFHATPKGDGFLEPLEPPPLRRSVSERFYLRDRSGRYLHQSLEPSPTDAGPLMTINRAWAWFDNDQRRRGAVRKWPQIASLRKEVPEK